MKSMARRRTVESAIVLGVGLLVILLIIRAIQQIASSRNPPAGVRVLLITKDNRLFQHNIQVVQDAAHGYPQRIGQWMAVVLDENRQPLTDFGIPDPRLALEHGPNGAVWLPIDSETGYLFDVVVPLSYVPEDTTSTNVLPRIIQIVDEAKTILLEVELTQALNDYCEGNGLGSNTNACRNRFFPLRAMPPVPEGIVFPNPQTPQEDRPEATTDLDLIFPSPDVELCIAKDDETTRIARMDRLEYCDILPPDSAYRACPSLEFELGARQFEVNESLDGRLWGVGTLALAVAGESIYTGNGVRFGPGSTLSLTQTGCLLTSIELSLQPVQQALSPPRLAQSNMQPILLWPRNGIVRVTNSTDLRYLSAVASDRGQSAQEPESFVVLLNLDRDIADRQSLPLTDNTTLRINALPLNNRIQTAIQGGSVMIERVRVNIAREMKEDGRGNETIVVPTNILTPTDTLPAPTPTDTPPASTEVATPPATEKPTEAASTAEPIAERTPEFALIGKIEGPQIVTDEAFFPTNFAEAPMLAEEVTAGMLPPVEERLPVANDLLVIEPVHEIGKYGGTWRSGFTGPADGQNGHRVAGGDRLFFWKSDGFPEMVPNVAKGWEVSADGKEITLFLRGGAKWSDGAPLTTADYMFWYEYMYQNAELVPVRSPFFNIDEDATLEALDDFTLKFKFPFANSLFLEVLGSSINVFGGHAMFGATAMGGVAPAHYMQQFHPDFVDQAVLDEMVKKEGFDNWVNLFKDKNTWARNPDLPVITPWKTVSPITTDNWVLERNPYYFGVDTAGNQLPYIDRISMTLAEDTEVLNLRAIAGEYDFQSRHISLANLPVLLDNAEAGNYTVHLDPAQHGADAGIQINQSYEADAEIGKWLRTTDFRSALSLGIDRDSINEIIFLGIGKPGSAAVAESSPFNPGPQYRQRWSTLDGAKANDMLDAIGLTERDAEGYRLRTDNSERLMIEINPVPAFIQFTAIAEMIKEDWAEIGIFLNVVEQESWLVGQRLAANELQVFFWQNNGTDELYLYPFHALPVDGTSGTGPGYGEWYSSGGTSGIEPPAGGSVATVLGMFSEGLKSTPEERIAIGKEIWALITDEVWTIGTVGQSGAGMGVRVAKNNMGNIPSRQFNTQSGQTPNISRPSTFFFTDAGE